MLLIVSYKIFYLQWEVRTGYKMTIKLDNQHDVYQIKNSLHTTSID